MARPNHNRGEVWVVDLGMAAKIRPCLVMSIQTDDDHDRVLTTLVPHTTSTRGSRFEIKLAVEFLKDGAFDVQNLITIPTTKLIRKLGRLNAEQLKQIEQGLQVWLGLTVI